jgi:hypothetical protein
MLQLPFTDAQTLDSLSHKSPYWNCCCCPNCTASRITKASITSGSETPRWPQQQARLKPFESQSYTSISSHSSLLIAPSELSLMTPSRGLYQVQAGRGSFLLQFRQGFMIIMIPFIPWVPNGCHIWDYNPTFPFSKDSITQDIVCSRIWMQKWKF